MGNGWAYLAAIASTPVPEVRPSVPDVAAAAALMPGAPSSPTTPQIASPWADEDLLSRLLYDDIYGEASPGVTTRAQAMAIPAVARARHLVCHAVARSPLVAMRGEELLDEAAQPAWLYRTEGAVSPFHRMLWTVDDLMFSGWSLWALNRSTYDDKILDAARVPVGRWRFDEVGRILVDDRPTPARDVLAIPGSHEGILNFGRKPLGHAADLEHNAAQAAANPSAYLDLHYTGDRVLSEEEIDAQVARWIKARRGANGGVGWTNKYVEARELGSAKEHLLVEGRNAAAVNIARLVSIPGAMLDATSNNASLTYETTEGRNGQFLDYGVSLYLDPIAARLSLDDVVPRGTSIRFDTRDLRDKAPAPTGPHTAD